MRSTLPPGAGVLAAAAAGPTAFGASRAGALAGGLMFLPFVWRGWLGTTDTLLLEAVGARQGWRLALWAARWTALAAAALAQAVWGWRVRLDGSARPSAGHAERIAPFPYVPAVLAVTVVALPAGA